MNILKIKKLVMILMLYLASQTQASAGKAATDNPCEKMNVILITISTLRADHVGCYGYHRDTTPNFDAFVAKGVLFENAFAVSSWQMPSIGSILTSLYPTQHGATHIDNKMRISLTLPQFLKEHGYHTAGFCCNPRLTESKGFAQGYDFYDDFSVNLLLENLNFGIQGTELNINQQRSNDLINDAAISFIKKNTHLPFFLSVHYYDNHWDYMPPKPYDTLYNPDYSGPIDGRLISKEPLFSNAPTTEDVEQIIALYDGQVTRTDDDLGEFLTALKMMGRFQDSMIIITADHGEQFYEHGNTSHHGLYDELIHVPLAFYTPAITPRSVKSLVSGIDLMPTILDCLNMPIPKQCMGQSLMPLIIGESDNTNRYIFAEYSGRAIPDVYVARSANFKYFQPIKSKPFGFDLKNDPHEQKPIKQDKFPPELLSLQSFCQEMQTELGIIVETQISPKKVRQ